MAGRERRDVIFFVSIVDGMVRKKSQYQIADTRPLKKSSSCSTIYLDDSTVSQPNLKNTVKCVALAVYYHIKNRTSQRQIDIFDEKIHPLTVSNHGHRLYKNV